MSKNAATTFYWKDWRGDQALRLCCLGARGLWMEMLSIMAEAEPVGFLVRNGQSVVVGDLAKLAGVPEAETETYVAELDRNGVFSRDSKGRIYSRRMVRDEKRRKQAQKNGKKGGNPNIGKRKTISASDNHTPTPAVNGKDKSGVRPLIPLNHLTTESTVPLGRVAALGRVCEALGIALTDDPKRLSWPEQLYGMTNSGLSLEADILPACEEARKRNIANLQWVRTRAEAKKAERSVAQSQAVPIENTDEHGWLQRCLLSLKGSVEPQIPVGYWNAKWGPPRGLPGHLCPDDVWAEAERTLRPSAAAHKHPPPIHSVQRNER